MADEARLTIVIEEPTFTATGGAAAPPADGFPSWYPRYRELRNRADMSATMTAAERTELDDLSRRLTEFASGPSTPPAPPPMPPATTTTAGPATPAGDDADGRGLRYRAMQKQAAGGAPLRPKEKAQLAAMDAEYAQTVPSPPLPAYGNYSPPSAAPPNWNVPPSTAAGSPPPLPPPPPPPPSGSSGLGPGFPGWDKLYKGYGNRDKFAGMTVQDVAAAGNTAIRDRVATTRAETKRREGKAWRRQFGAWQEREDAATAGRQRDAAGFDAATSRMSPRKQAGLGAVIGGVNAARAGTSLAGGAMAGAAAAAGGPIGLALLAKDAVDEFKKKVLAAPVEAIESLGGAAKKVAGNDGLGLFKDVMGGATAAVEKIPFAGENLAAGLKTASTAVTVFADVATAFAARGKELSGYSGALAGSVARTEVANITADIREAEVLGPDLSRLMDLVTDFEQGTREILLPIKKMVVEELANFLTNAKDWMSAILTLAEGMPGAVGELAKQIRRGMDLDEERRRLGLDTDPIQGWLGAADGLGPVGFATWAANPSQPGMLPAFGR